MNSFNANSIDVAVPSDAITGVVSVTQDGVTSAGSAFTKAVQVSTLAGSIDGFADGSGTVYVAERGNHKIRKITQ